MCASRTYDLLQVKFAFASSNIGASTADTPPFATLRMPKDHKYPLQPLCARLSVRIGIEQAWIRLDTCLNVRTTANAIQSPNSFHV